MTRVTFSICYTEQEVQNILSFIPDYVKNGYIDSCVMYEYKNSYVAIRINPIISMKDIQMLCRKIKVYYRYEE